MAVLDPSPISTYTGPFTASQATRLLWRAGFGPTPGQAAQLAGLGLDGAVASLTRPVGAAVLQGPAPWQNGVTLNPLTTFGDANTWWLDRMIRSNQSLIERMTLIWHSWFPTSVWSSTAQMMINQNWMMRGMALGNFHSLLFAVTEDPAMLMWLSGASTFNVKDVPNENYGREMMERFTLGPDSGYTQQDVEEQARALSGWTHSWNNGPTNVHYDPTLHDPGMKTIFGQTGAFTWQDSCRLVVNHPAHPAFMVTKLWNYFVGAPPPADALAGLCSTYVKGGLQVQPLVEAILRHPLFYQGPLMVIPPAVYVAGLHRALGLTIATSAWSWICTAMGQLLFFPPDVGGWDYTQWLDTARWQGRLTAVNHLLTNHSLDPNHTTWPADETPEQALATALQFWDEPVLTSATSSDLIAFGNQVQQSVSATWEQVYYRVMRQNALRTLIPTSPDWQTC